MAVLPKKYSKRGPIGVEDYILYMSERIELYAQGADKRIRALEKKNAELEKENKALKEKING